MTGRAAPARLRRRVAAALCGVLAAVAVADGRATAAAPTVRQLDALRVCADPNNLPFSDAAEQGFENKLAEMIAAELGVPLRYTWFPQTMGSVRATLGALRCDVILGITTTSELVQNTNPYYRSVYVLVYRQDSGLAATTLADPALAGRTIGVIAGTPPASRLAALGLMATVRPYQLVVDTRFNAPGRRMIEDVAAGRIDAAVAWGPIGGYFGARQDPPLVVVPLTGEGEGARLDFRVSLGVRTGQDDWKHGLNDILVRLEPRIETLLRAYDVPLVAGQGPLAAASMPAAPAGVAPPVAVESAPEAPLFDARGYRVRAFRSETGNDPPAGAAVIGTAEVATLVARREVVLVDALPAPPRPSTLAPDSPWLPPPRDNIPGSLWLPDLGQPVLEPAQERRLRAALEPRLGAGQPVVAYCRENCWYSWNAAKRLAEWRMPQVRWYPGGTEQWTAAGHPTERATPALLPVDGH